ncbi:glycosyltransferase family 4 protein [Paraburkholderia diazotrophica]|uniref:glycosyltransferase family 4 protein n=1 Tax=Paraburkholderia diazotrophica TaxID=667676 RepID=UPI00316CB322
MTPSDPTHAAVIGDIVAQGIAHVETPHADAAFGNTSPTVLFIDQSGELGGAEFALLPLARHWASRGKVLLLSDGPFRERLESAGVSVDVSANARVSGVRRDALRFAWLGALPAIAGQALSIARQARRYDVVFLNTQKALVLGAFGKLLHGRPIVWYLHDILSRAHFGRMQLAIVRWLALHAVDHVIANSRASADALVSLTLRPDYPVRVVHNGIDAAAFSVSDAQDRAALRRRLGLPEDAWLAGLFGRLAPWKGQHVALAALAQLPGAHLVLAGAALFGEHEYERELHRQAQALGVANRVHFAGFCDDVPEWMSAMDVIVHTSTEAEPFGRVIVEGMMAERAVIATAAGGVKEIVTHGENGWLVEPGNADELAAAMSALRDDPMLAQRLAAQGRADAKRNFSLDAYLRQMSRAIGDVAL